MTTLMTTTTTAAATLDSGTDTHRHSCFASVCQRRRHGHDQRRHRHTSGSLTQTNKLGSDLRVASSYAL